MNGPPDPRFVTVRWLPPGIVAITLPPLGVLIRQDRDSERLRRHEAVHWDQYQRYGVLGFYLGYLWHWVRARFSYRNHPWEVEARRRSGRSA